MAALLACVVGAGCSGEPPIDAAPTARSPAAAEAPAAESAPPAIPAASGAPVPGASVESEPAVGLEASTSGTPPGQGAASSGPAVPPAPAGGDPRPAVPVFAAAEERVGISDEAIKLCTHVNGQASAAIGGGEDDLRVFWRWVNDQGGIHGRKVEMVIADDGDGTTVASAYEECRGSFLILGGPTQEAIPAFREIVERDPRPTPYVHFMARADPSKRYSFSWYPTQERFGALTAAFVLDRYPGKRIGVIRRDLDNWEPGYRAFVAELERRGVDVVTAVAHPAREQVFEPYLAELAAKQAEVVWAWNHGVEHVPMLKQANARGYRFSWVLGFPLAFVSETMRNDLLTPVVTGVTVFPAFRPGLYDEHHNRYREEGQAFERAYQRYRVRSVDPVFADLLFRGWLDARQVADLLEACGPDCTRTKVVTTLVGRLSHRSPSCPFDFSLGRAAGNGVSAVEAYAPDGTTVAWRETAHCVSRF